MELMFPRPRFPVVPGYELLEKLAKGSYGEVYKARRRLNGQNVAIKVVPAAQVPGSGHLRHLEQEFQTVRKLTHPNIVQVIEFGRTQNEAFLVTEYVEGISLGRQLKRSSRLPEVAAVRIIVQIAQALQFAHERGLVHRDVNPSNILVCPDGRAKLGDFGLVKDILTDSTLSAPSSMLGIPQFTAPEEYQNLHAVNARADVYSLAATFYFAVTGILPFGSCKSYGSLLAKMLHSPMTPPRELVPTLSPEVNAAILCGMNPTPEKRLSSCSELIRCLSSKKMTTKELAPQFESGQVQQAMDRRACMRYSVGTGIMCILNNSVLDSADAEQESWPATLEDVSQTGMAISLGRRLERNTLLSLEWATASQASPTLLTARVVRVQAKGFGHWLIGCQFIKPMDEKDLPFANLPALS